ncbi:hypothetical protein TSAR_016024 [Trichomalopsis sarcophagae]|uniref:Uncharacterized protein n=1 Tax=Trichomalopsis sarcophagae TaxID=543379 RepID=A0A232EVJ2_9HYME|nr:hypothetical protein TSAR_016024 [Trichomalopsis sarcophagae]
MRFLLIAFFAALFVACALAQGPPPPALDGHPPGPPPKNLTGSAGFVSRNTRGVPVAGTPPPPPPGPAKAVY